MRTEQSDRIVDLIESSKKVESEIETHAEEIGARLDARFEGRVATLAEGETPPNFRGTLLLLKDELSASRERVAANEQRHIELIRRAVELRDERGELTGSLYDDFSSIRRSVEELYINKGKGDAFVFAGIQGPTSQVPATLNRQLDIAIEYMLRPETEFPAPRFRGGQLNPQELASELQPRAQRLTQVRDELQKVGSQLNATRKEKNRAVSDHKDNFLWIARGSESYFMLAGEPELARRIRPSVRRRGRRAAEVEESQEGASQDGGASDEGSSDEAGSTEASSTEASSQDGSVDSSSGESAASASSSDG